MSTALTRSNKPLGTPIGTTLTRTQLRNFDKEATELIMEAMAAGMTGRISNRGHALLYNNTGGSCSVSRNLPLANRTAQNTRANVKRLIQTHDTSRQPAQEATEAVQRTLSVAEAFIQHGGAFSTWFDQHQPLVPDDLIDITIDTFGVAHFRRHSHTQAGLHLAGTGAQKKNKNARPTKRQRQKMATEARRATVNRPKEKTNATAPARGTDPAPAPTQVVQPGAVTTWDQKKDKTAKVYPCPHCERTFTTSQALAGHTNSHRELSQRRWPCADCGRVFATGSGLGGHRRTHRIAREKAAAGHTDDRPATTTTRPNHRRGTSTDRPQHTPAPLGTAPDPLTTPLINQIKELRAQLATVTEQLAATTTELMHQRDRCTEAQTRLELIKEALSA